MNMKYRQTYVSKKPKLIKRRLEHVYERYVKMRKRGMVKTHIVLKLARWYRVNKSTIWRYLKKIEVEKGIELR